MRTASLLLCALGWHHPAPGGRWNRGYCFSRCARCGRDMIRAGNGQWRVPNGYRVVWKRKDEVLPRRLPPPSADVPRADPPRPRPAASAPPAPVTDFMSDEAEASDWLAELQHELQAPRPLDPGDFMSDSLPANAPRAVPPFRSRS